ncbi:MAG: Coenzyme F420 hydrogenase/dehydrogenase, beta subunit C-terminal domain [Bacteroides sp.]|nr:Coenzyme F420 hydrogenase/dehydrogenase, beta subunit C-terminal domain [Roseburia sp.]MCM1347422.1 Coenzyme F420 hydrogenase/dehydrogenase, beta subunit C-terminal domain [Bacteroides sp.]MCM1421574.1 Coenzyme F420 hydrogenase/dehydrogenase, beta subunit C-terminal domain [Bacteroides sp.]
MINITNKRGCCGCSACLQKCPQQCIDMREDKEGFLYPHVNTECCIDCGLCETVCPFLHPGGEHVPKKVLAVINNDDKVRMASSSGGVFTLIAERVINGGGVVFGARFDDDWQVVFDYTENMDGLAAFRGSKYVQSRIDGSYRMCERFLKSGRRVLFTGSPCQIAGLNHYLRKPYKNLLTCDFVCHGVPSPKVWQMYLKEVVAAGTKAVSDIKFRNKAEGWKRFNFIIAYDKGKQRMSLSSFHGHNHFMRAFLSDLILRPSCYSCKAKQGCSGSDLTIADFWGVGNHYPEMDDDKGTSLVMINSDKGMEAIDFARVRYQEAEYAIAARYNAGLKSCVRIHPKRERFFSELDGCNDVVGLITKYTRPSVRSRLHHLSARAKKLIKRILNIGGGVKKPLV